MDGSVEFETLQGLGDAGLDALRDAGFATRVYVVFGEEWFLYVCNRIAEEPDERIALAIVDAVGYDVSDIVDREPLGPTNTEGALMGISGSLVLIAAGAILKWAVTATVSGVNLQTIGVILMVVGAVGLVLSLVFWSSWGGFGVVEDDNRRARRADPVPLDR